MSQPLQALTNEHVKTFKNRVAKVLHILYYIWQNFILCYENILILIFFCNVFLKNGWRKVGLIYLFFVSMDYILVV